MSAPVVYDVVCGMSAPLGEWQSMAEHNGKTYFFCCDGCKSAFVKSPDYHLANFTEEHPGVEPTQKQ